MNDRLPFNPLQAQEVARAFNDAGVEYLFIDIIASKKSSGRMKDRLDLHLLELFRLEFESRKP